METSYSKSHTEQMSDAAREAMELAREEAEELGEEIQHRMAVSDVLSVPEKASNKFYMGMALGSILVSLILYGSRRKDAAIFVGHWAPTFLAMGLFAKLLGIKK